MTPNTKQEFTFRGTPISPGIAFGPILVRPRGKLRLPKSYKIKEEEIPNEKKRIEEAFTKTKKQIRELYNRIKKLAGEEGKIFVAHLMMLEDSSFIQKIEKRIEESNENAETAFYGVIENYLEALRRVSDPYLKERTADIEDVGGRVLENLQSKKREILFNQPSVLLTYDLLPSEIVSIDRSKILALLSEHGSETSHTAILARSFNIPAIGNLENEAVIRIKTLTPCIVDGYEGKLIIYPSEEIQKYYRETENKKRGKWGELKKNKSTSSITCDGREINLSANIEFLHNLSDVKKSNAKGVGLFRTEFFILKDFPDEEKQTEIYSLVAEKCYPHSALIRTLDVGGDKLNIEKSTYSESNPFLGWRGIRVSLEEKECFKTQIKALLRASKKGKIGITLPLITTIEEIREAKEIIEICKEELGGRNICFDENILIGVMIEVPSAALISEKMAKYVDYFSIGTNDLIQYTMATDRTNPLVKNLYQASHPAVLKLIQKTVESGEKQNIPVSICGEMASNIVLAPLLIGLGITSFSTNTHQILLMKKAIQKLNFSKCRKLIEEALEKETAEEILKMSKNMAKSCYQDLLEEML